MAKRYTDIISQLKDAQLWLRRFADASSPGYVERVIVLSNAIKELERLEEEIEYYYPNDASSK